LLEEKVFWHFCVKYLDPQEVFIIQATDEKKEENRRVYETHHFWQDVAIKQMSAVNNWALMAAMGFLSFCIANSGLSSLKFEFVWHWRLIDWAQTCYFWALLFTMLSILSGVKVLIARLIDFKINRNITLINRYYATIRPNFEKSNHWERFLTFLMVLVHTPSMSVNEYDSHKLNEMRHTADKLGDFTWSQIKCQIFLLLSGIILYFVSVMIH
jgi:hypothetical protein